jgi:hypothetical protein
LIGIKNWFDRARKLDEERRKIEDQAVRQVEERHRLKDAEKDKQPLTYRAHKFREHPRAAGKRIARPQIAGAEMGGLERA